MWRQLREWFELDVRSLAVFRVSLAAILLVDLAIRSRWIDAHYSDLGILPNELWRRLYFAQGYWSLHALRPEIAWSSALFAAAALAAIALLVGWRTRVATVVSWILLVSLHNRCPPLLNSGDDLLRLLVFWSMFLPLGAAWSVDARSRAPEARAVVGPHTVGFVVQVVCVYWTVVLYRTSVPAWADGSAVWLALQMDGYTTNAGRWVRDHLTFALPLLTYAATAVEGFGPLLAFSPWRTWAVRTAGIALLCSLHLSFGILMEVGLFWSISCTGWIALLPGGLWTWLSERWAAVRLDATDTRGPDALAWPAVAAIPVVLVLNTATVARGHGVRVPVPTPFQRAVIALRLDQNWTVYSPPTRDDGWFVARGVLADGREVDLWTGASTSSFDRPPSVNRHYRNQRWRHVLYTFWSPRRASLRGPFADWLADRWEREHPDTLERVELFFVKVRTGQRKERPPEVLPLGSFPRS